MIRPVLRPVGRPTLRGALLSRDIAPPRQPIALEWDDEDGNPLALEWDDEDGNPLALEWDR